MLQLPALRFTLTIATTLLMAGSAAMAGDAPASAAIPVEGVDYTVIDHADAMSGSTIEVVEVFSYRCIHCAHFQPELSQWEKTLPADVHFSYLPAAFGGPWDTYARAFFAARAMGVQQRSHDLIFKAVFEQNRVHTDADLPALYADYGIDPKDFAAKMQDPTVDAELEAARRQAIAWGVDSTPTIVIDGRYRAQMTVAGGAPALLHTVDWLIAQERILRRKH